jgi:ATP-dependent DNA ligase
MCELYAKQNGKPLMLPQFIHAIKGNPPQLDLINIGIFDILTLDGQPFNESPIYKWQTIEPYLKNCTNAHILPYMKATTKNDVYGFWKVHVHDGKYEGLVVRTSLDTFKVKPAHSIDCVIIGINKKSGYGKGNLFAQNMVTTIKLALMTPEGYFVEIGDCASGIDHQLRRSLWKLMDYKISEDDKCVYVKPFVIIEVEYTDLFKGRNQVYELTPQGYYNRTTMNLIRFRHPRLIRFRTDKKVTPTDIGLLQIPEQYLNSELTK